MQAWSFRLKMADRTITTHVYSDTGEDIVERFPRFEVSDIKKLDKDPTTDLTNEEENDEKEKETI
jgi:hypothetical protein